jgi:hypothetical protein
VKVSGFTIARNAVKFGYPLKESIQSLLPLVDEYVVGVGDGADGTWELVKSVRSPKVKPFRSTWDLGSRQGGEELSRQTNLALKRCRGDWAVYLQADELLHEEELPVLRTAMEKHLERPTEALTFEYYHFYGSYQTIQDHWRKWYRTAVRAVKTGMGIESVGDAYGFRRRVHASGGGLRSLRKAASGAHVYHYGWVRPPHVMLEKQKNLDRMYHDEAWLNQRYQQEEKAREFYRDRGHLKFFSGTHPAPIQPLAKAQDWEFEHGIDKQWPDWMRYAYIAAVYPIAKKLGRR